MIFFFCFFLFLSFFSVLGYGLIFNKIFNLKFNNLNLGKIGILGLFLLTVISSFTHIFMPHTFTHNIFLISLANKLLEQIKIIKNSANFFTLSLIIF